MKFVFQLILMLVLIQFTNVITAQNTIINSHFFNENVKVEYQPTPDSLVTYEDKGKNKVWNYAQLLKKGASYKRSIKLSEKTPHAHLFPKANFAIEGQDKDYVYLNVEPSKTEFIGFVPPDSSFVLHNYQPWSISVHPMKYGDTIQTPAERYIKSGAKFVFREGNVTTTAIAEGKLILPHKEYNNVLKIKEVQTFYNPTKTVFYQATTYHWLSNESNFPLMSCNTIRNRNSKGEEQITKFAQYIVNEENTNQNKSLSDIISKKPLVN